MVNGDFENGNKEFTTDYSSGKSIGPGNYAITDTASKFYEPYTGIGDGLFMVVDGGISYNQIVWQQSVNVKENTNYAFSCLICNVYTKLNNPAVLNFYINGNLIGNDICPNELYSWKAYSVALNSENNNHFEIRIVSKNSITAGNDFGIDNIELKEVLNEDFHIEDNKPIILKNVLLETNSAAIRETAYAELNKLAGYLSTNTNKSIEIEGYTDNIGNDTANQLLSEKRAKSVMDYLIQKGINNSRILTKKYGKQNPIDSNETPEGSQQNRRVVFVIK